MTRSRSTRWGAAALLAVALPASALSTTNAQAATPGAGALIGIPSAVPAAGTPNIDDGRVYAFAQVGSKIITGGTFTKVSPAAGQPDVGRTDLLAFDAATGKLDPTFAPVLDGEVRGVAPGPVPNTVYVVGQFKTVNGVASKSVALIDTTTGNLVPGWKTPTLNGEAWTVKLSNGRLFVGGTFTTVGGKPHAGLVTLNPTTGALDPYLNVQLAGHHNYTGQTGQAEGAVGAFSLDITPDGSEMVVVGNFKTANGVLRDQIVRISLGATAVLNTAWATSAYSAACSSDLNDSYMRGVSISPDGSYFVVATTGGYAYDGSSSGLCDSAARWDVATTGADVQPAWVDYTGGDSLESVAVTNDAVYVGGHMRWLNNPTATYDAHPGAVPRPGLAALDPVNGLPLAWNPGRNPRGAGASALLATSQGLYVGSDTAYIGNRTYLRGRVAFFPVAGGSQAVPEGAQNLPVQLCVTAVVTTCRSFDGSPFGAPFQLTDPAGPGGVPLAQASFAFTSGSSLYAVDAAGNLSARSIGTGLAAPVAVDPYDDPAWANVADGFYGGQTYRGLAPALLTPGNGTVTSSFVVGGTLYYTYAGDPLLHSRPFTTSSGIIGGADTVISAGVDLSGIQGAFAANGQIFMVSAADGSLTAASFANGIIDPTTEHVVSGPAVDGIDWRGTALFALPYSVS